MNKLGKWYVERNEIYGKWAKSQGREMNVHLFLSYGIPLIVMMGLIIASNTL